MEIDGVFSGGGMKGYALAGAISTAEEKGFHFVRVAGASAGALIASFIAAGYSGTEITEILLNVPRKQLLDPRFKWFPFINWLLLYWQMGIYKGDAVEKWLTEVLAAKGIQTFADLKPDALRIVTSDLSTNALIIIPDDLPQYGIDPQTFPVAKAVRMSISIPYIFRPVKLKKDLFVDGGLLSNFPMWLFGKPEEQIRPVLGIKLTPKEKAPKDRKINNAFKMFSALFETMLNAHDLRYISRKIEKDILFIPLKEGTSADFEMPKAECLKLIEKGKETAKTFFQTWSAAK